MSKKKVIIVTFLIGALNVFSQDFNYKFCVVQKDATAIAFEFTVCNNSGAALNAFDFVFNWPGISNVTVDNGLEVIKNGNTGVVELQKQSWAQPLNPGCNNKFTVRMNYEFGMFPPVSGILNGDTIPGITCYVPPSFENFTCKKDFNATCFLNNSKEIKIGEGTVRAWNSTRDVYIPANRKGWAIGMAVAHGMFTNLMGFDCLTPNEYFATAMQESSCGCDGGVTAPPWVTNPYNIQPLNYCADLTHGVAAGFFQEEYGTGWIELEEDIPCFIPTVSFDQFIIGSKFETQALGKVYHDFNNISYWQYIKCWNPIDFLKNAKDPYAAEKIIALGYNRGLNSGEIGNLLTTNRAAAITATNILPYLNPGGVGWVYAEQISRISAVLDDNMGAVDPADPIASSVPYPGVHSFRAFYDTPVSWADISAYIDVIAPMYAGVGLNAAAYKNKIQNVFNSLKGGSDLSFRYELSPVIDALVLNLPAFDPKFGLGGMYINSGGSSCKYPTAALSKSDTVCMGSPLVLTVKLTGTPPWSFSYQNPNGAIVTLTNITTSPYSFVVKDTGTYYLTAVADVTGTGEAICLPITKAYIGNGALAKLLITSSIPCGPQSVQIKFTGTGPFDIEYTINGTAQTPINGITQNPYTLIPAAAPVGTYVLTRLKANGCDIKLADTVIVHPLVKPAITIDGNQPICAGQSLVLTVKSPVTIVSYSWLPATGLDTTSAATVIASPSTTTHYTVTVTASNGCVGKDSVKLTVNQPPVIALSADTTICALSKAVLNATGGDSYSWAPPAGLNVTNASSVIATPTVSTQYTVTATTSAGCKSIDSVNVNVINCNFAVLVKAGTVCEGTCRMLSAAISGGTPPYTFMWQPGGLIGDSVNVCPTVTTTYTVTVTDKNGDIGQGSAEVKVVSKPTVTVNSPSVCIGEAAMLTADGAAFYKWSTGATTKAITVSPLGSSSYTVTGISPEGCLDTAVSLVTVKSKPVVNFGTDTAGCGPLSIQFTNLSTGMLANATCSWDFGNGVKQQSCTPKAVTYLTGNYEVSLTVDNQGCSATTKRFAVTVYPSPTAVFTADPKKTDLYNPAILFTKASADAANNNWSFGDGTVIANTTPTYKHTYDEQGTYQVCLEVSNLHKCVDRYCEEVVVGPAWALYIPNAFKPNGLLNPVFKAKGANITEYNLMIFDRWGNLIFESSDLSDGWDGRVNHGLEIAPLGVYVYKVSYRDGANRKREQIGSVTLLQ
jgi:gliding motility-associated-like protein